MDENVGDEVKASQRKVREITLCVLLVLSLINSAYQAKRIDRLNSDISNISVTSVNGNNIKNVKSAPIPIVKTQKELEDEVRSKDHNYIQEVDRFYYYEVPHSKKDEKSGKGTYDVLGYRYFGVNEKGTITIKMYSNDQKRVLSTTRCVRPCKVVNDGGEIISVGKDNVLSNVVSDAVNGALLPSLENNKTATKKSVETNAPINDK